VAGAARPTDAARRDGGVTGRGADAAVAVLDVGKTNVKLSAVGEDGRVRETLSCRNPVRPGPPYRHHDLGLIEAWLVGSLSELGTRHPITAIVATGHGSGGVLVGEDGPLMPMIDYEQAPPDDVARDYPAIAGSFRERGSPVMLASAHLAKQMVWLERHFPDRFAAAKAYLAHPQYWAWRLSGAMTSEVTSLAAQSHLWCSPEGRPAALVEARGWGRLLPPIVPAWQVLGPLDGAIAAATGLPRTVRILTGVHDSSANFYRYQAAGLSDMVVVSTGTWIVPITDRAGPDFAIERPGLCCNADVFGRPVPGMLVMGGREFDAVAAGASGTASREALAALVATRTMALPSFSTDDSLFPGTSQSGTVVGPLAADARLRLTLAVLYSALLTDRCLDGLTAPTVILDGSFARDALFGGILATLRPERRVLVNPQPYGTVSGAALLATHETREGPVALALEPAAPVAQPDLIDYARAWRERALARRAA
jgi:sugar (pentulose or hexulose) kinase